MFDNVIKNLKTKSALLTATTAIALSFGASTAFAQPSVPATPIPASTTGSAVTTGINNATAPTTPTTPPAAGAPDQSGTMALTAIPPRYGDDYSLVVQPGQQLDIVLEVRNPTSNPVTIQSIAKDFIIGEDGETPLPIDETNISNRWSLASWLTITPNTTVVEPRQTANVLVTINVPADALPGGHYAMVLHKPAASESNNSVTGAAVSTQVGTLLYVVVDGEVAESASINNFNFTSFSEHGPVDYSFEFSNDSSMHVRPEITMVIKNIFGQISGQLTMDQKNVFPGAPRVYTGSWDKVWGFGPYTAQLNAVYGRDDSQTAQATVTFWILPIRVIIAILVVILIIIAIIVSIKRKYSKMLQVEANKVKKLDEKLKKANQ